MAQVMLFHRKLRKWKYIFYLNYKYEHSSHDINPILDVKPRKGNFCSCADGFPTYTWKQSSQFDNSHKLYKKLKKTTTDTINYFQTGVLYFDTELIENETMSNILKLIREIPDFYN